MLSVKLFPGREAGWYNQFGDVQPGEGVPAGEKQWIPHLHPRGGGPVSCTHRQHQTGLDPGHPGLDQETRGTSTTGMRIDAHQCIFNVHACMLAGAFFSEDSQFDGEFQLLHTCPPYCENVSLLYSRF